MRRRGRAGSRGQSLAEFALVAPLFLLVVIGIAEGGYYVAASATVNHATHEGARFGVLASTADKDAVVNRVQDAASAIVGSSELTVGVCVEGTCTNSAYDSRDTGDRLKVSTQYTHTPLLGYVFSGLTFPANAEAELLVEGAPSSP